MDQSSIPGHLEDALAGHYTVERELGRGGMATVYVARDTKHGRRVALKVLRTELAASLGADRFRREITLAAGLQHPHIVPVHDSGESASGILWFTMPLIEGESLRDRLRRQRQLPIDEALRITREVALALDYAHRHGVIHRDIKPENILLVDGQAMVADFGIARPTAPGVPGETLTGTGMAVGTAAYMSPEQAAGERTVDGTSDVYSLGVVLYEMLAGEPPYTGPTAQSIAAKMMVGELPTVRRTRPGVPEAVDGALRRALAPVPADRFKTAAQFAHALDTAERTASLPAGSAPGSSRLVSGTSPRLLPRWGMAVGLGIILAVGLLAALRHRESGAAGATTGGPVGIAVLPFDTQGDTANAYLADGITGEIRGKLSALPGLSVIATTSSNQYRHTQKPADQIGRELGVRYLLTGTVEWERGANNTRRVRVSPELVEVREGAAPQTRWEQSYDTTLADVFDVQAAVAARVADKLGVVLSAPAQTQLAARPTQNLAAYDAYVRSIALDGYAIPTLRSALVAADQAVALDSGFAAAWARVSLLHTRLYNQSVPTRAEADVAVRTAEHAIALAPTGSEGYYARGAYNINITYDLAAAREAFSTAIRLDPSSTLATGALGSAEAATGQWTAALGHARRAVALDPRSPISAARLTLMLLNLRRYAEARAEAERGLTFAPADFNLIVNRAASYLGEGDLAGARAALRDVPPSLDRATLAVFVPRDVRTSNWGAPLNYWALDSADRALVLTLPPATFDNNHGEWGRARAELYWLAGDTVNARRYADTAQAAFDRQVRAMQDVYDLHLLHGLALVYLGQYAAAVSEGERGLELAQTRNGYHIPYARHVLARIYLAAGDHAHAIDQLDSLLAKPAYISAAWLGIEPTWAPLRGDPRFERLLTRPWIPPVD